MPQVVYRDFAQFQLTANVTTSPVAGTQETWSIGSPVNLPALAANQQYNVVVQAPGGDPTPEVVTVVGPAGGSTSQAVVLRGQGSDGRVKAHTAGDTATLIQSAAQMPQMVTGTLSSINWTAGTASVALPSGATTCALLGTAITDPSMTTSNTVFVQTGPNGPTIVASKLIRTKPSGRLYGCAGGQQLSSNFVQSVWLANTEWAYGGMNARLSGNNSLTTPIAGLYRVGAAVALSWPYGPLAATPVICFGAALGSGAPAGRFRWGVGSVQGASAPGAGQTISSMSLNANQEVSMAGYQLSGTTYPISNDSELTHLEVTWDSWIG